MLWNDIRKYKNEELLKLMIKLGKSKRISFKFSKNNISKFYIVTEEEYIRSRYSKEKKLINKIKLARQLLSLN